jgi:hypothetical protein
MSLIRAITLVSALIIMCNAIEFYPNKTIQKLVMKEGENTIPMDIDIEDDMWNRVMVLLRPGLWIFIKILALPLCVVVAMTCKNFLHRRRIELIIEDGGQPKNE